MKKEILIFFSKLIQKESGIIYSEANFFQLENRLLDLVKELDYESVDLFYNEVKKTTDVTLIKQIINKATNHETSFFRDAHIFKAIQSLVEKKAREGKSHLKFWSAACSSGQEVVSLNIALKELLKTSTILFDYGVFGNRYFREYFKESARFHI